MTGLIQAILEILAALPAAVKAITGIIDAIKGQPKEVKTNAVLKAVQAAKQHCDAHDMACQAEGRL